MKIGHGFRGNQYSCVTPLPDTPSAGVPFIFDGRTVEYTLDAHSHIELVAILAGVDLDAPAWEATVREMEQWASRKLRRWGRFRVTHGSLRVVSLSKPTRRMLEGSELTAQELDAEIHLICEQAIVRATLGLGIDAPRDRGMPWTV